MSASQNGAATGAGAASATSSGNGFRRTRSVRAFIALGGNLGNRRETLDRAARALRALDEGDAWACSAWIETEPVGGPAWQGRYLNGVCRIETTLAPAELLERLAELERAAGRVRVEGRRDEPRPLDLDLLLHGDERIDRPGLCVPHPRMEERVFVLAPLAELEPELVLPGCGLTVRARLEQLRRPPMQRWETPRPASHWAARERREGRTIGFVPTMGALHEGHLTLVRRAAAENDVTVVSVFVNPLQFDDPGDLAAYPRDFEGDCQLLERAGCSAVFTGTLEDFFPGASGGVLQLRVAGPSALGLEGAFRAGHFDGVATIVGRLFELVRPTRAYFGQKDFQQTLVVGDVARSMGYPEIVVCATSRDADGLARSSRNTLLAEGQRDEALALSRALAAAHAAWASRERDADRLCESMRRELADVAVEYAEVRDPQRWTAERPRGPLARAQALVAARVGTVRLIDNLRLDAALPPELQGSGGTPAPSPMTAGA